MKSSPTAACAAFLLTLLVATPVPATTLALTPAEARAIAKEAYVYGGA